MIMLNVLLGIVGIMLIVGALMLVLNLYRFSFDEKMLKKFNVYLVEICKEENIYIDYHDSIEDLNQSIYGDEKDEKNYAVGVYQFVKTADDEYNRVNKYPRISLLKKIHLNETSQVMTFAHEIGHHLAIKNYDNRSEEMADTISVNLFRKCFSKYDLFRHKLLLEIYSEDGVNKKLLI